VLREELKRLARAAEATPPCAPLAAVEEESLEESPRGAAGSADPTPRAAALADDAGPAESGAGCTSNMDMHMDMHMDMDMPPPALAAAAAAAAAWPGPRRSTDELDGVDEDEGDPMIAIYLA
jgi:hypothetical protein